ncbi:hypothetical protein [Micromonospora auratinigra]|uniref:Uncharacterized protein n=1 Tax=Micromonospora auratinigra TaxID=261654 RepID=A0A1A8Z9V0_9ACTN|nr:hypothetical protein [Micromonospora auratinigra]SBT40742.1 hypothetical protein GA0070611_1367 [Micromonospora auratinigra]
MLVWNEWRPFLRRIVQEGGDIGDIARAVRDHGEGRYIQAGGALHQKFGLPLADALKIIAWAESNSGEDGLTHLRAEIQDRLSWQDTAATRGLEEDRG